MWVLSSVLPICNFQFPPCNITVSNTSHTLLYLPCLNRQTQCDVEAADTPIAHGRPCERTPTEPQINACLRLGCTYQSSTKVLFLKVLIVSFWIQPLTGLGAPSCCVGQKVHPKFQLPSPPALSRHLLQLFPEPLCQLNKTGREFIDLTCFTYN